MYPVLIDPRIGSGDLLELLQERRVPSKHEKLDFGDVQIIGRGPEDRPVPIGVEIKAPSDLLNSLRDARLVDHQLPGMLDRYEQCYLLVEGIPMEGGAGALVWAGEKKKHPYAGWNYDSLIGELTTLEQKLGIRVNFVQGRRGSAAWVAAKWKWWNGKAWDAHRSHLRTMRLVDPDTDPLGRERLDDSYRRRMLVAAGLGYGIGFGGDKARKAAEYFPSVDAMMAADESEWMKVPGVGKTLATRLVAERKRI